MERLRIKGKGFGQVNVELLEKYKSAYNLGDESLNKIAKEIIETLSLNKTIKNIQDIYEIEKHIKSMYYRSIGEYLDFYMRNKLESDHLL